MKAIVTQLTMFAKVAIQDVLPYAETGVLSDYKRVNRLFQPVHAEVSFSADPRPGEAVYWRSVTVRGLTEGTRPGKLTRQATVAYSENEDGSIEHWPAYVRIALNEARGRVKL
jgi:hypothetical protein